MADSGSPTVFIDRDGTLMEDVDYCGDPKDVRVFAHAADALRKLKQHGYKLFVITNQSGIGRGYFSEKQYRAVEREVSRQLGDGLLDATYFCPHRPDEGCKCRKPAAGMVMQAAKQHDVDLARSFLIGDKDSDLECGRNAGVKTILVRTGCGDSADGDLADFVAPDVSSAATLIVDLGHE